MDLISRLLQAFADHCQNTDAAHADHFAGIRAALARIEAKLDALAPTLNRMEAMSETIDGDVADLAAQVGELTTEVESANAFMDGIEGFIKDAVAKDHAAGASPETLANVTKLAAAIGTLKGQLAASILKNTPSDPEAPPATDQAAPPVPAATAGDASAPTPAAGDAPAAPAPAGVDPVTGGPVQPQQAPS